MTKWVSGKRFPQAGVLLDDLRRDAAAYFLREVDAETGLIADRTEPGAPCSIAAVGMGLTVYAASVEGGLLSRSDAVGLTLRVLRFLASSRQGREPDATGYKGFYYHFLDKKTGRRAGNCELSTIDTAILMAGVLTAATYFDEEPEIRSLAEFLYQRVDWRWAQRGQASINHGWKPETGFRRWRWDRGYSEAHILYVLALGSPTFPIEEAGYQQWISTFEWEKIYGIEHYHAGPFFIHQLSQIWLDCRGVFDAANRRAGIDYFENSRRAAYVQRAYGIANPLGFAGYGENGWGLTASDGPGPAMRKGRRFFGYRARGVPWGPDDGTLSPWAIAASLPFAPDIVLPALLYWSREEPGVKVSVNPSFSEQGWVSPWLFGLNQGPVALMIGNYQSETIWRTMKRCPAIVQGMRRAGFAGVQRLHSN